MTETDTTDVEAPETDEARDALLEAIATDLGDAVADTHLIPGRDVWIRVSADAWADTATYLHEAQRFRFFNWLSAIDWLPSPFGRSMDAEVDKQLGLTGDDQDGEVAGGESDELRSGVAGGNTRFQVLARVHSLSTGLGLTVKADVGDDLQIATWTHEYPGADWHEREAYEMFGIRFVGHPGLRNIYLPGSFEGHPLRKDFPLVARLVKPWPGIVDVEPMPEIEEPTPSDAGAPSADNPEDIPADPPADTAEGEA